MIAVTRRSSVIHVNASNPSLIKHLSTEYPVADMGRIDKAKIHNPPKPLWLNSTLSGCSVVDDSVAPAAKAIKVMRRITLNIYCKYIIFIY